MFFAFDSRIAIQKIICVVLCIQKKQKLLVHHKFSGISDLFFSY